MGQILAIYMGLAIVICHFFRKFCQDPEVEEADEEEEDIETLRTEVVELKWIIICAHL